MNSSEVEKLEANKSKKLTKSVKLENWGLREKIRYQKLKTGIELLKSSLNKSQSELSTLKNSR